MSDSQPRVGIGCIVVHEGRLLLVRSRRSGRWSPPGGNLDFGESPADCAARETLEETGLAVSNVRFVAITNDVMRESGTHYVTIWMAADADDTTPVIHDTTEIDEVGWFDPERLPRPLHVYFENLIAGRTWPENPPDAPLSGLGLEQGNRRS